MFGDSGFFAKVDIFNNFIAYAEKLELKEREKKKQKKANFDSVSSKVFCQLALINYRITAHYEQGMLQKSAPLSALLSMEYLQHNASMAIL
jgi:hypothetical protein